jgi:hypothetical protein
MNQTLYLYRYYKEGLKPFRSTSNLNDNEIIHFMEEHFPAHTWFHADPKKRIDTRRKIERWLHHQFLWSANRVRHNIRYRSTEMIMFWIIPCGIGAPPREFCRG